MAVLSSEMVHALLAEHPNLDAAGIQVDVSGRRVVLHGQVRTQRERDEAEAAAQQLPEVDEVSNDLLVLGEPI